ncbi:hypothetical protein PGT21_014059 [Puccinia graminis f. sp. tritici]|uniref:Uncharacterized protein n=1 Tax=Puccinia graminis f. sp. tritici TaxID=56615 RepID=A0A5B0NJ63_PUCGR|nr:hypothetical protein PGT21_014059 [Puccinia graminis f. sp. tritici]KAA1091839.1 hypothetical protein PGTUg99_007430 [Puccinia graminis f. sp. tritici]
MRGLELLCRPLWLCGIAFMHQLTQAAFHPIRSTRVRLSGLGSSSGSKNYYRPIPENEGRIWAVGAHPEFHHPRTSGAILEVPSTRRNTGQICMEGHQLDQTSGSTSNNHGCRKSGLGGDSKRARLEVRNWATNEDLESFLQSDEDQLVQTNYSGSETTGNGSTLMTPSLTELDWDLIWKELNTVGPTIAPPIETNIPAPRPNSKPTQPGSSLEQPKSIQLPQEDPMEDELNKMLKQHQPNGIHSPLSGIEPPIIRIEATLDQRDEPEYARLADQYVQAFEPEIRSLEKYQFCQDFWMGQPSNGVEFPEGGLIVGPLDGDPKEPMAMIVPLNSSGSLFEMNNLLMVFKELHKWIIHTHGLLCKRFKTAASAQPDLQSLEFWLLGEIFSPKQGLPVIGRFCTNKLANRNFEAVQEWVVKYLVEKESALTTSLAIIAIWFKNTCPKQWKRCFRADDYFWAHAATLLQGENPSHLIHQETGLVNKNTNRIIVNTEDKSSFKGYKNRFTNIFVDGDPKKVKIGNFQLLDMTLNPPHIPKPKGRMAMMNWMTGPHMWKMDQGLSGCAHGILDRHAEVSANELGGIQRWHKVFPLERVVIARFRNGALCVRHLSHEGDQEILEQQWFKRKLRKLLSHMDASSLAILTAFASLCPATLTVPLQVSFFEFLSRKLFGTATEPFFPLFGPLDKTIADLATSPAFDEVQLYLLKVFHDESPFKYLEAALTLLGYWLKNENQYFWNEHIKSDQFYSQFIISALPKRFNNLIHDPPKHR